MASQKLTENEIRIMIVPKHVRWPEPSTSMAWARLHHCVRALHLLAQSVDNNNLHLNAQYPFDGDALVRNRTELCAKTVEKLAQFAPLRAAERAVANELRELNQTSELSPQQQNTKEMLEQARAELTHGIGATIRLVQERCGLRQRPKIFV